MKVGIAGYSKIYRWRRIGKAKYFCIGIPVGFVKTNARAHLIIDDRKILIEGGRLIKAGIEQKEKLITLRMGQYFFNKVLQQHRATAFIDI